MASCAVKFFVYSELKPYIFSQLEKSWFLADLSLLHFSYFSLNCRSVFIVSLLLLILNDLVIVFTTFSMVLIISISSVTCSSQTVSFPLRTTWIFNENIDSILLLCSSEVSFQVLNLFSIFLNNSSFWQLLVNLRFHHVLCSVSILHCTLFSLGIYRCGRNSGYYWCPFFSLRVLKDPLRISSVSSSTRAGISLSWFRIDHLVFLSVLRNCHLKKTWTPLMWHVCKI